MSRRGYYMADPTTTRSTVVSTEPAYHDAAAMDEIRASIQNLRYGSVTIIVQDGVIIQIDRTEKRRLPPRRANPHNT